MYRYFVLPIMAAISIGIGVFLDCYVGIFTTSADYINYYGFSLTIMAIAAAVVQSARNHDWNRRQLAITTLLQIKEKLGPYSKIVHEEFGYLDRREDDAIPVHEIHEKICKDKVNGKIPRDDKTNRLELDEEKSEIYKAIRETLNLYEYVASGVHQGVFDKDIVADLFRSNVIKTASVFSAYIDHINHEMNPRCNGSIWVNLKTLGAEFKNNYREGTKAGKRGPA